VDKAYGSHTLTDWLRILHGDNRAISVIVWGAPLTESEALRYFQAGAAGIVRKSASLDHVWECIRTVAAGGAWMEHEILRDPERPIRSGRSALTSREVQVMELVERGYRNKEIGNALGICTGTVKIHLKHIFEKTGIRGRYGLAVSCLREKNSETMELKELVS